MNRKKAAILSKIVSLEDVAKLAAGWQVKNEKIVFTNGCFDLLHAGHIQLLLAAAAAGNKLIVALNTDSSVRQLKGERRPVMPQDDRALLLAAQTFVDAVVLFDTETPLELIRQIRPDVLVKGGDYRPDQVVGASFVNSYGGEVLIEPLVPDRSTTTLLHRICG